MKREFLTFISFISFTFLAFSSFGFTSDSVYKLSFDPKNLIFEKVGGYDRIEMVEGKFSVEPGYPLLPVRFVQFAIPIDLEMDKVEIVSFQRQELSGTYQIYPAQPLLPLSDILTKKEETDFVQPNSSVYNLSAEYPGKLAEVKNNGYLGGNHIAGIALYPLQYIPSEGKLIFYTQIEFKLIPKPATCFPIPINRRSEKGDSYYSSLAKSIVINPEEIEQESGRTLSQGEEVEYLIITGSSMVSAFQQLANRKNQVGMSTQVKDLSWIISYYPGYDTQEKVRNCIRDYYSNYGTRWVLLGGDTPIIPHRTAQVMGENIPCDLYYSDLDGDWDADGDHIYGEYEDSVDMYPEVFVGRAPANNLAQAQTFVNKCLTYDANPPSDYLNKILYAAEQVWVGTDASQLKNYIDTSFVPDSFQRTRLYQTSGNLNRTTFRDAFNSGQNIINHNGHGNYNLISIGGETWNNEDMDSLVNGPRYSLFYTYSCISNAIDTSCLGEHFINNPNGGGVAYCGNSRYGWGVPGAPLEGPGSEFDIEFFRTLFDSSIYQVGKTLGYSKIPFIPIAQADEYYRWTMFTLLLLGDPTLELWTAVPSQLTVNHSSIIFAGINNFEVNVLEDSALVSCIKDGELLGTAYSSGGSAAVYFKSPVSVPGDMQIKVIKHNYYPYCDTVMVIPPEGPYVIYQSYQVNDSAGNNNGVINQGDTIFMPITVKNIGLADAHNVQGILRENDNFVIMLDSLKSFSDINSGMTAVSSGNYIFVASPLCPDSHQVKFTLDLTDGDSTWSTSFFILITEPDFVITIIPDTVIVHQGDSASFKLLFTSLGGFNLPVELTNSALPSGVSGILEPAQLIPTDSSTFKIYAALEASPGSHSITISVSGGGIIKEKQVALGIIPPAYYGPVWHISTSGHDIVGNGSEDLPFRTINKGIKSAFNGDTVLVEKGRYFENINFSGRRILVTSRYIYDGLESTIDSTIIDGDSLGSVVTFESGEDSSSAIFGFTLTNGYKGYGGGIYCHGSSPTIVENFLVHNSCNTNSGGSAIYCDYGSNPRIFRNLIAQNEGPAAIFLYNKCYAQLVNNTVCDNSWGGLSLQSNSLVYLKNNIFYNNNYYGIHAGDYDWGEVLYNDSYGNQSNYMGRIKDQTGINGNISAGPLFVNPSAGDYHLNPGSPCIDSGDPADSVPLGGRDRVDMGAFEVRFEGPWVTYRSHQINDTSGNNNRAMNPGETISMPVILKNNGTETAYGVRGILSAKEKNGSSDQYLIMRDTLNDFGNIEPGKTTVSFGDYQLDVLSSCPDTHRVTFNLELTDGSSVWTSNFSEMVAYPGFTLNGIPDTIMIFPPDSSRFNLVVISYGGFKSQVNLSYSDLPSGISAILDPDDLVPTDTSIFKISATTDVSPGNHPVTITASGAGIIHQKVLNYLMLIKGDADRNGKLGVSDIVYLINFLFKGGYPPIPSEVGDVNCDKKSSLSDVVYLINYLFKGGPPPC